MRATTNNIKMNNKVLKMETVKTKKAKKDESLGIKNEVLKSIVTFCLMFQVIPFINSVYNYPNNTVVHVCWVLSVIYLVVFVYANVFRKSKNK